MLLDKAAIRFFTSFHMPWEHLHAQIKIIILIYFYFYKIYNFLFFINLKIYSWNTYFTNFIIFKIILWNLHHHLHQLHLHRHLHHHQLQRHPTAIQKFKQQQTSTAAPTLITTIITINTMINCLNNYFAVVGIYFVVVKCLGRFWRRLECLGNDLGKIIFFFQTYTIVPIHTPPPP